jgi:O-antigen/teichoic acid export membrane protein
MGSALGVTAVAFFVAMLFHARIFSILVAKDYRIASYLLPWLTLAAGLFATGQVIALNLMSQMKTRIMMKAKIGTAILGVLFNLGGAYLYGIQGVVAAILIVSALYFFWMLMLLKGSERAARD